MAWVRVSAPLSRAPSASAALRCLGPTKSIYSTFGADPAVVHPDWKSLGVDSAVEFDIDDMPYRLLRSSNIFALFAHDGTKLWSVSGVNSKLAPKLADILSIKLRMQSREGEFVIPPPAYFFSPFYVDQDTGWQRNWSSFASMQQFEKPRPSLALFHAGVRPNEYYAAQADKIEADRAKAELSKERDCSNARRRGFELAGRHSGSTSSRSISATGSMSSPGARLRSGQSRMSLRSSWPSSIRRAPCWSNKPKLRAHRLLNLTRISLSCGSRRTQKSPARLAAHSITTTSRTSSR